MKRDDIVQSVLSIDIQISLHTQKLRIMNCVMLVSYIFKHKSIIQLRN